MRYGTFHIAIRTKSIKRANLSFSLLFGGGAKYGSGEDVLFLMEAMKKGLKVYTYPVQVATVSHAASTWFSSYDEKYFKDKGALFAAISKKWAKLLSLLQIYKHKKVYCETLSFFAVYKLMCLGIKEFKER